MAMATLLVTGVNAQRDAAPTGPVAGTASIAGVVVAGAPPAPLRRAIVTISAPELPASRSAITDDQGRFAFANLPAGRFAIVANKPAYLPASYGASRPGRPGTALSLGAGQRTDVSIAMAKGAVLSGVIREPSGAPLADVTVAVINKKSGELLSFAGSTSIVTTDDRGSYRVFGVAPGEYIVMASQRSDGRGAIQPTSTSDLDATLAALQRRATAPGAPPALPPEPPPLNYAPVYYPGSAIYEHAVTITVAAAEERHGLDFVMTPAPALEIEGVVLGEDGQPPASVQLSIIGSAPRSTAISGSNPVLSQPPGPDGKFKYTNVPPGFYTVVARSNRGAASPGTRGTTGVGGGAGGGMPVGPPPAPGQFQFAIAEVDVTSRGATGLTLHLRSGATLLGRVVFDGAMAPPADLTKVTVGLSNPAGSWSSSSGGTTMGTALTSVPRAAIGRDGTFTATNIAPGRYNVGVTLPESPGWWLRSAVVGGRDVLDTPLEVKTNDPLEMVLTLTDRRTEISGLLQGAEGRPATEFFVIAFSADRTLWRRGARRIQVARPGSDGRFFLRDLPPGEYYLAALTDVAPDEWYDPVFLDQVIATSQRLTLGDGERKVQNYRIGGGTGQ